MLMVSNKHRNGNIAVFNFISTTVNSVFALSRPVHR